MTKYVIVWITPQGHEVWNNDINEREDIKSADAHTTAEVQ